MERGLRVKQAPTIHPSDYNGLGGIGALLAGIGSGVISAYGGNAPDYLTAGYLSKQEQNNAMYDLQQARNHDANAARVNEFMTGIASPNEQDRQAAAMNNPDLYNVYAQMQPQKNTFETVDHNGVQYEVEYDPQGRQVGSRALTGSPMAGDVKAEYDMNHQPDPVTPYNPWQKGADGAFFNTQTREFAYPEQPNQAGQPNKDPNALVTDWRTIDKSSSTWDEAKTLQKEQRADNSVFNKVKANTAKLERLLSLNTPMTDMTAFISYIAAIDNSVVRGEEARTYSSLGGPISQLRQMAQNFQGKGTITAPMKAQLRQGVKALHDAAYDIYRQSTKRRGDYIESQWHLSRNGLGSSIEPYTFSTESNGNPAGKNGSGGGFPQPPQAAMEALYKNPSMWQQFESKYGSLPAGFKKP